MWKSLFVIVVTTLFIGGCSSEEQKDDRLSKIFECQHKNTLCHEATFDEKTETCTERHISSDELTCNVSLLDTCIESCQCLGDTVQMIRITGDDNNPCTKDECTGVPRKKNTLREPVVTHTPLEEGDPCGPNTEGGQCHQGLCVLPWPDGRIYTEEWDENKLTEKVTVPDR